MDRLIRLLAAVWDWFAWFARSAWTGFIALIQTVWGKWLIVVAWLALVLEFCISLLERIVTMLGGWIFSAFDMAIPSEVITGLSLCNHVFPLVETIIMIIAYANVLLILIIYRHVKSYVPGAVSGGT